MIENPENYKLNAPANSDSVTSTENHTMVVFDACVAGIATADSIKEIFPNSTIVTMEALGVSQDTDDSKVCEILKKKIANSGCQLIFVTKNDRKSDDQFWSLPDENVAVIRFTNGGATTDSYISSLFALTKTRTYKNLREYFGKDIRLGPQNVYHFLGGTSSDQRELKFPHSHSKEYKHFIH